MPEKKEYGTEELVKAIAECSTTLQGLEKSWGAHATQGALETKKGNPGNDKDDKKEDKEKKDEEEEEEEEKKKKDEEENEEESEKAFRAEMDDLVKSMNDDPKAANVAGFLMDIADFVDKTGSVMVKGLEVVLERIEKLEKSLSGNVPIKGLPELVKAEQISLQTSEKLLKHMEDIGRRLEKVEGQPQERKAADGFTKSKGYIEKSFTGGGGQQLSTREVKAKLVALNKQGKLQDFDVLYFESSGGQLTPAAKMQLEQS